MARDAYLGSDTGSTFDTYLWATPCDHETMAQLFKYKFDDNSDMSASIAQFMVCNSPSNLTSKLKVDLEKIKN